MKRILLALIPLMVLAIASAQDGRLASVAYSYHPLLKQVGARLGDELYLSPSYAKEWGWEMRVIDGEADILAEGRRVRVVMRYSHGSETFPLVEALNQLGAHCTWSGDNLIVQGAINELQIGPDNLRIDSTLAVKQHVQTFDGPERTVIDLDGAWLSPRAKASLPRGVRIAQFTPSSVRVVVDKTFAPNMKAPAESIARALDLKFQNVVAGPVAKANPHFSFLPLDEQTQVSSGSKEGTNPLIFTSDPVKVESIEVLNEDDRGATVAISLSGPLPDRPQARYDDPESITLQLANALPPDNPLLIGHSAFVSSAVVTGHAQPYVTIAIRFKRPVGFELETDGDKILITLVKPRSSDGRLADKIIVVDAGHGGSDSGAKADGVLEKDLTLQVAKKLGRDLVEQGAAVIMTRYNDTFIPLGQRSAIANQNRADLFISVHINSNQLSNSATGTITFFHNQDPIGSLLAECIEAEIAKVSKLPAIGTWSDTRIYHSGFAVLRNSAMPAVLIELGFINSSRDRARLREEDFHEKVALAIVRGIKVFLGDGKISKKRS